MKLYQRLPFFYGWIVAAAAFTIMLVSTGMMAGYAVFIEPIARYFSWSRSTVSLAYSLNFIAFGASALAVGQIAGKIGFRRTIFVGGFLYGLGLFLGSFSNNSFELYIFYGFLAGIGTGALYGPMATIIAYWFSNRKGLVTGLVFSGSGAGTILFPSLGRYLIASYDWKSAFLILGLGAIFFNSLAALLLKEKPKDIGLTAYGDQEFSETSEIDGLNSALDASERSIYVYNWTSRSAAKTKAYWSLMFTYFFCCICHSITLLHTVSYAADLGIARNIAAFTLSLAGVFIIIGRVGFGALADIIGCRRSLLLALASQTFVAIWLLFSRDVWNFYIWAIFFGLGYGGTFAQYPVITRDYFGLGPLASIFGSQMGVSTAAMAIGGFFGSFFYDLSGSYTATFTLSFLSGVASLLVAWGLKAPEAKMVKLHAEVQIAS